jgi:hypothetical protein
LYFDASTPHSYQCAGKKPATAIIVTMHQAPSAHLIPLRSVNAQSGPKPINQPR